MTELTEFTDITAMLAQTATNAMAATNVELALSDYLIFSAIIFSLGVAGLFINRKNLIVLLMCLELMLLAVNTNFIAFARYWSDMSGQIFVFFILTVAAVEAAIGLAILVVLFRERRTLDVSSMRLLKG